MPAAMTLKFVKQIKGAAAPSPPPWHGPQSDGPHGGVTASLLSRYLSCAERFRLLTIEGLQAADTFRAPIEFGSIWHAAEEALAAGEGKWLIAMTEYGKHLCKRYPTQQSEVQNWWGIAKTMFPLYVEHWSRHPDVTTRKPIFQEQTFKVPYKLPSGRIVYLRGKWDSVDECKNGKAVEVLLQENKTKSRIDEPLLKRQLTFDNQTMIYLVALTNCAEPLFSRHLKKLLRGVRYNVVKRPSQYQGKKETREQFLERLAGIIKENPDEFFMRWRVDVGAHDIDRFRRECLDPVLENLCDDFEWWTHAKEKGHDPFCYDARGKAFAGHKQRHLRMPFGIYSPIAEGRPTDMDEFLAAGSTVGLQRVTDLFPELK